MATERLSMVNAREVLRQKWELNRSNREIGQSVGRSPGLVSKLVNRALLAGLDVAALATLTDEALEQKLYGPKLSASEERAAPDPVKVHREYQRPGVTLQLLHLEYLDENPNGLRYTAYCEVYRRWLKSKRLSMRQLHRGGEKCFVDYSGKRPEIMSPLTGELTPVELFVCVLGASSYTYAEATRTQQIGDWLQSHVRAFEYFGGVTEAIVPDNLKSGVTRACFYEPDIQRSYLELCEHYGAVALPARARKPKDKAKVEVGVQVTQRWVLAVIRNETFFSLDALNARIRELLAILNAKKMRGFDESRYERFLRLDKPFLKSLPKDKFEHSQWKRVRANIDYHIDINKHYYSVPFELRGQELEARFTQRTVEVFLKGVRVATHPRSFETSKHTTVSAHMPKAHQAQLDWSPSRILGWAEKIGPNTRALSEAIMNERQHPEQGYRSCLGILRLEKPYGAPRLEAACGIAVRVRARSYKQVEAMLRHGRDRIAPATAKQQPLPLMHENVRGAAYYEEDSNAQ